MQSIIRAEAPRDHAAIYDVTKSAFAFKPYAGGDEQVVPERLRRAGRLVLSLVAEVDGEITGHIAFSRMLLGAELTDWYAIGPVSVSPKVQKSGIGSALIKSGIATLTQNGAQGFALTGNPAYYSRFGFRKAPEFAPPNEPAEYFQILTLNAGDPPGRLAFDPAFYG